MNGRRRRVLAALSALLLAAGAVLATVARPSEGVSARVSAASSGDAPLLVVGPAVLASRPGPVVVRASGSGPVLVAVGRDDDVTAWAQGAAVTTATALQGGDGAAVATTATAGEAQVPDPSGSDLWTAQSRGSGSAELTVDPAAGSPGVLVASDGTAPAPGDVELVWTHRPVPVAAWALLGVGALLGAWLLLSRRRATPVTVVLPPDGAVPEPEPEPDREPELLRPRGRRSAR